MDNIFVRIGKFWDKGIFYKFLVMVIILFTFGLTINGIAALAEIW